MFDVGTAVLHGWQLVKKKSLWLSWSSMPHVDGGSWRKDVDAASNDLMRRLPRSLRWHENRGQMGRRRLPALRATPSAADLMQQHTVEELKELLREKGLSLTGRKSELAQRLADELSGPTPQGSVPEGDLSRLLVSDLKSLLRQRGLPVSGRKEELLARLEKWIAENPPAEGDEELPTVRTDTESKLDEELATLAQRLRHMKVIELKDECKQYKLAYSGSKEALARRLYDYHAQRLVQAVGMETPWVQPEEAADSGGTPLEIAIYEQAEAQVMQMDPEELQEQVQQRMLRLGTRTEMVESLARELVLEASGEQGQPAAAATTAVQEDAEIEQQLKDAPHPPGYSEPEGPDIRVAVICGGPSGERGVSINSARTLLEHLRTAPYPEEAALLKEDYGIEAGGINVEAYYVDHRLRPWKVTPAQLFSNNPSDFDFKLPSIAQPFASLQELAQHLKPNVDIVFPTIHGMLGEDGQLARILDDAGVPYVGTPAEAAEVASDKWRSLQRMKELGFPCARTLCVHRDEVAAIGEQMVEELEAELAAAQAEAEAGEEAEAAEGVGEEDKEQEEEDDEKPLLPDEQALLERLARFMQQCGVDLDDGTMVVKPARGGSSLGVMACRGALSLLEIVKTSLLLLEVDDRVLVQPFFADAMEFSCIVVDTDNGPMALPPTHITVHDVDEQLEECRRVVLAAVDRDQEEVLGSFMPGGLEHPPIFDFRRKYLPTTQVRMQTPPVAPLEIVEAMQSSAEQLFRRMGLRDWARIDGFVHLDPWAAKARAERMRIDDLVNKEPIPPVAQGDLDLLLQQMQVPGDAGSSSPEAGDEDAVAQPAEDGEQAASPAESGDAEAEEAPAPAPAAELLAEEGSVTPMLPQKARLKTPAEEKLRYGDPAAALGLDRSKYCLPEGMTAEDYWRHPGVPKPGFDLPEELPEACRCTVTELGVVTFTDINLASGTEQNSFLFHQAAEVGLSHAAILRHIASRACQRAGLDPLPAPRAPNLLGSALMPRGVVPEDSQPEGAVTIEGQELPFPFARSSDVDVVDTPKFPDLPMWVDDEPADDEQPEEAGQPAGDEPQEGEEVERAAADAEPVAAEAAEGSGEDAGADTQEAAAAAAEAAGDDDEGAEGAETAKPRMKVWVLMGGDTSERQVSLMSGVNVWLKLNRYADIQADPFLLAPLGSAVRENERLGKLLQERTELLKLGVAEEELLEPLQAARIRNPDVPPLLLERRQVWAVPYALALRHSCEDVQEACERELAMATTLERCLSSDTRDLLKLRHRNLMRLATSVPGVGDLWDDRRLSSPLPPRILDMQRFAYEAQQEGAVVFLALHGGLGEDGTIQAFLDHHNIPYTGSDPAVSELCMNKSETADALEMLAEYGVAACPKQAVQREQLLEVVEDDEAAEQLLTQLQEALGLLPEQPLCLKPAADGCSTGVAQIATAEDLQIYAIAMMERWPYIPQNVLSKAHTLIEMPRGSGPSLLLAEPFVVTDEVLLEPTRPEPQPEASDDSQAESTSASAEQLVWKGSTHWLEVTCTVLGPRGEMMAFTPSITVKQQGSVLSLEEKFQGGTGVNLTPPPESIVPAAALEAAQERFELVANHLGLEGLARIDAFMHADTGELYIIEVNTVPGMTASTVLLHQALCEDPAIYPHELFRMALLLAVGRHVDNQAASLGESTSMAQVGQGSSDLEGYSWGGVAAPGSAPDDPFAPGSQGMMGAQDFGDGW